MDAGIRPTWNTTVVLTDVDARDRRIEDAFPENQCSTPAGATDTLPATTSRRSAAAVV